MSGPVDESSTSTTNIPGIPADRNADVVEFAKTGALELLESFDIRNGEMGDVRSIIVKPSIPDGFKWSYIEGLDPSLALQYVSYYIAAARQMLIASAPAGYSTAQLRKAALLLGVSRATMTAYYRIQPSDLIPGEIGTVYFEALKADEDRIVIAMKHGQATAIQEALKRDVAITPVESAVMPSIHMCAMGVPPVQGYSLVMTNHHYLSDVKSQSFKAFLVMEKAHWTANDVTEWWTSDIDKNRDVLFHKSGHPISMVVKRSLAFDEKLPKKLTMIGAGAAASRLPAVESQMRAANSYLTLMQTVKTLFESYGGSIEYTVFLEGMDAVRAFPSSDPSAVVAARLGPTVSTIVNCRNAALDYLQNLMDRNRDTVAYCFGFYVALSEQSAAMGTAGTMDTLKTSYALSKLKQQSFASYIAGNQAFGDYNAARSIARSKGAFDPPRFTWA